MRELLIIGKLIDLTGKKFGRLTVIERAENRVQPSGLNVVMWLCECDCKNKTRLIVNGSNLRRGHTTSCGCYNKEIIHNQKLTEEDKKRISVMNKKYNTYDLESEEYGIGYTLKGEPFYFDKDDYDIIKDYCWSKDYRGALCTKTSENKNLFLHRLITNAQPGYDVDHISHQVEDNRKCNLRVVEHYINNQNNKLSKNNTSGVKGVSYVKNINKWNAFITVNKKK